jgi:hypothetical protein
MYAETLDADYYRERAKLCHRLAEKALESRPLYARLFFLARAYEDKAAAEHPSRPKNGAAADAPQVDGEAGGLAGSIRSISLTIARGA